MKDQSRLDASAETAIYIGCSSAYVRQNMAIDTVAAIERLGVEYTIISDEWCCGHPYMAAGEIDKARESLRNTISQYVDLGVKRVVFNCPGCLKTFKHDAPEILGEALPFEPMHLMELVAHLADEGQIQFKPVSPKINITYHDSCTMGRWLGIYDAPRTVLNHIYGVGVIEMPRNQGNAYCCGAGGLIRYDFSDISDQAGIERFQEAEATGADVLMTSCPACLVQFQQTRSKQRSRMKIMDITQLIWDQLAVPDKTK